MLIHLYHMIHSPVHNPAAVKKKSNHQLRLANLETRENPQSNPQSSQHSNPQSKSHMIHLQVGKPEGPNGAFARQIPTLVWWLVLFKQ
jgi:hypothetical protein